MNNNNNLVILLLLLLLSYRLHLHSHLYFIQELSSPLLVSGQLNDMGLTPPYLNLEDDFLELFLFCFTFDSMLLLTIMTLCFFPS